VFAAGIALAYESEMKRTPRMIRILREQWTVSKK
jgi:hypothetical protein